MLRGPTNAIRWSAVAAYAALALGSAASAQQAMPTSQASATAIHSEGSGTLPASPIETSWRASTRNRQTLWLLSTRRLPSADNAGGVRSFTPDVSRFQPGTGWVTSSLEELIAAGQWAKATSLYFHGNDTSAQDAAQRGESLYQELKGQTQPVSGGQPVHVQSFEGQSTAPLSIDAVQFVVWSWPSEIPGARVRESAQANSLRTNVEGEFLAKYLSRLPPDVPVNLCGYCTGARIATGGLHLLAAESLSRAPSAAAAPPGRKIRAVLLAGALPHDWLLPGQPQARALSQLERLVITVNDTDPVLRWYPLTWGRGGPTALGMTGLAEPWRLGDEQAKIVQLDFEPALHRQHSWQYYRNSPQVMALLRRELLGAASSVDP